MKFLFSLIFLMLFSFSNAAFSQEKNPKETNPKWDIGLEGMFGMAVGKDFYAFNVGGPSLLLRLNNDLKVGFGALPSFYIKEGKTGAKLGVSPRIDYKNLVLIAPFFHFDDPSSWTWSVGIGYKFHRK